MLLIGLAVGLEGGGPGQADAVRLERRHVEAGLKAARRSASREASSHFEQALGEHQRCLDLFREASALAEGLGDRRRLARAATLAWRALPFLGQYRAAIDAGQQALDAAEAAMTVAVDLYQAMGASAWLRQAEAAWSGAG